MYRGMRPEPADRGARSENDLLVTAIEGIRWDQILAA
jgi:hypothetical protein